jgi:hypothetical protein
MMRKLFGADGIREVAYVDPMTGEMAMQSMFEGEDKTKLHRFPKDFVEWVKKRIRK